MSTTKESFFTSYVKRLPHLMKYMPPELNLQYATTLSKDSFAIDAFCFGCLIAEVFNGNFSQSPDVVARGNIPLV
jgi:hypothetical protein